MEINEYKEIFLNEAREYLSSLNNALALLEKDPTRGEAVREIARAAHSVKDMSATMGYEPMARLTHQDEGAVTPFPCRHGPGVDARQPSTESTALQTTARSARALSGRGRCR